MRLAARLLGSAAVLALSLLGLWRILATGISDHLTSSGQPRQALEWDRNNSTALAAIAFEQLGLGNLDLAAKGARSLLQREPLNGQGFLILAGTADAGSNKAQAMQMYAAAIRRAPYSVAPRAALAGEQLSQGKFEEALESLDGVFQISGAEQARLFPALIELAANPQFADALAMKLATGPIWRAGFVSSVLSSASPEQLATVLTALQHHGDLDAETTGHWIDRLIKDGQWGEAYARWVSGIQEGGPFRLSHVYNGDFETEPVGAGFDWRIGDSAGILIDRSARIGGGSGHDLRLTFLDRRVESIPLHQWLMLGPGTYRLRFSATAQNLRSNRGVQWVIRCVDGNELAASDRLTGQFDWKQVEFQFDVPAQQCVAQDLWLRNAGEAAAGKMIGGAILFDDFSIERVKGDLPSRK